jgi:RNA 2',3'-cyclic 3'-phosphodiesterase
MRLFVAVNLPPAERDALWQAAAPLREAGLPVRWVAADCLHITIKFLGEVDESAAEQIATALSGAMRAVRPFDVVTGGIGAFPDLAHPRVVWCGVEVAPALELLANDVERALKPFDFGSELAPFRPHVTLGRAHKDAKAKDLRPLAKLARAVAYDGMITVSSVDLMHSTPGPAGSRYVVRHAAPLAGTGGGAH